MTAKKTKTTTKTQTPQAPKPAKIKTKTEVRNAAAQADKLIRGIDNNNVSIRKHQDEIEKKISENAKSTITARSLIAGISNAALVTPAPAPAAKPAAKTAAKPAPKAKPTPKKPAAKASPKKAAAKPAPKAKPAKAPKAPESGSDLNGKKGFKLDVVARDIIAEAGKPLTAAEIYHGCEAVAKKHGFKVWSRQSLYNQLKITTRFTKSGDGAAATFQNAGTKAASKATTDQDAEDYVKKVEKNTAVANVS